MAGSSVEPAERVDPLLLVQCLLGIKDGHDGNPAQIHGYRESHAFHNTVFLNIGATSRAAWENENGAATKRFEVSVLDTSELSNLPSGEIGTAWIAKISTNLFVTHCNSVNLSSARGSVASQISTKMAQMPRNAVTDGIRGLKEQIQASQDVKYVLVHHDANADAAYAMAIKQRISNGASNQVSLVSVSDIYKSAAKVVTRYDGRPDIANILKILKLQNDESSNPPYPTALMLKALIIMAVESVNAYTATIPTSHTTNPAPTVQSHSNADASSAQSEGDTGTLYMNRGQIEVPMYINRYTSEACTFTEEFVQWLVQEAEVFTIAKGVYTEDGDPTRLKDTSKFIALAQMVRNNRAAVGALPWAIDMLNINLRYRREVTKFFTRFPCKEGSQLDKENKRHVHFNEEVLAKVLMMLDPKEEEARR